MIVHIVKEAALSLLALKSSVATATRYSVSAVARYCPPLVKGGRMDRASGTEAVDSGSVPGRVKPKTIKIGIHSFPACRSAVKGTM